MICVFKAVFLCACYCNKKILTMVLCIWLQFCNQRYYVFDYNFVPKFIVIKMEGNIILVKTVFYAKYICIFNSSFIPSIFLNMFKNW